MVFLDGEVYNGEWKNGMMEGKGRMDYQFFDKPSNNRKFYDGHWKAGKYHLRGTLAM